jgi:hypothetical protein
VFILKDVDLLEEWKVLCEDDKCFASNNGIISVLKIDWLIRCECCGRSYDESYFKHELRKVGIVL